VLTYEVEVCTGKQPHAGTDANVHVMLVGQRGDTGRRRLLRSLFSDLFRPFQPGQVIIALCELNMHAFYCVTVARVLTITVNSPCLSGIAGDKQRQ